MVNKDPFPALLEDGSTLWSRVLKNALCGGCVVGPVIPEIQWTLTQQIISHMEKELKLV